ncbi:uncharacterized protein LOC144365611 [Ictidomys tridecemlineatus]
MVAGGGVSESWPPPEQGRRRPVTRLLFLRAPRHVPGGVGQRQAVGSTRVREPEQRRERLQHLGGRKAECGGRETRPPHSTASSRRWPGRDCMVRARRRVPPAARLLPCRGLRAPANSWGRWLCYREATGCSAPPPRSRTLPPTFGGHRAAQTAAGTRPRADCPLPPCPGHLPLMPAGTPRPGPAPSSLGSSGGPPGQALRASPPTAPQARPLPRRPLAPPWAGSRRKLANRESANGGGGANANHAALRTRAGNPGQKSLRSSERALASSGLTSLRCGRLRTIALRAPTRFLYRVQR